MIFDFAFLLLAATLVTGILYAIDHFVYAPRREAAARRVEAEQPGAASEDALAKIREPNALMENARAFFPVLLIVLVVRSFIVEPFRIPSGSMLPTLYIGDFILVNKFSYGLRLPAFNNEVLDLGTPERGDVVVFRYPEQPAINYIKRVVALPGDRVAVRNNQVVVWPDCPAPDLSCERKAMAYKLALAEEPVFTYLGKEYRQYIEHIPQKPHYILQDDDANPFVRERLNTPGPFVRVPDNSYFVLGDNRDHSKDSRVWGFVPEENLVGKAFGIWLSLETDSQGNIDWPLPAVRFERLGSFDPEITSDES